MKRRILSFILALAIVCFELSSLSCTVNGAINRTIEEGDMVLQESESVGIASKLRLGDFIAFGRNGSNDFIWQIIDLKDGAATLFEANLFFELEYDASFHGKTTTVSYTRYNTYGSATWEYSDIRQWLNSRSNTVSYCDIQFDYGKPGGIVSLDWDNDTPPSYSDKKGFLCSERFSDYEYSLLLPTTHLSLIPQTESGLRSVMDTSFKSYNIDPYEFYHSGNYGVSQTTDLMYLLSGEEYIENVIKNDLQGSYYPNGKAYPDFWLRDSVDKNFAGFYYYFGTNALTVDYGKASSQEADLTSFVRPACRINLSRIENLVGDGSIGSPYRISKESDDGSESSEDSIWQVGDHIVFGSKDGIELPWQILSINGSRALLFCDYIVDLVYQPRTDDYHYSNSALREWCQAFYYSKCFSQEERQAILPCSVDGLENETFFVFSSDEFLNYFPNGAGGVRQWFPALSGKIGAVGYDTVLIKKEDPFHWLRTCDDQYWIHLTSFDNDGYFKKATSINCSKYASQYGICPAVYIDLTKATSLKLFHYPAYSFLNSSSGPYAGFNDEDGYYISGDYYAALKKRCNPIEYIKMLVTKKAKWGGHCFGLSSVYCLFNSNLLDLKDYHIKANTLSNIECPKNDKTVLSLFTYYHLLQCTEWNQYRYFVTGEQIDNSEEVVQEVRKSPHPVTICFTFGSYGHAVVALNYRENADYFIIGIWDPNYFEEDTLYVAKDYESFHFASEHYPHPSKLLAAYTIDEFPILKNEIKKKNAAVLSENNEDYTEISVNYTDFEVSVSDQYARFEDGKKVSGNLAISDALFLNDIGGSPNLLLFLNHSASSEEPIIIRCLKETTEENETIISFHSNKDDGYLSYVTADLPGEVTIGEYGCTTTHFKAESSHSILISRNTSNTNWPTAVFHGCNCGFTVTPDSDSVVVTADNATIETEVSNLDRTLTLGSNVITEKGINVYSTNEKEVIYDNSTSQVVSEGRLPFSVWFYSLGGTLLDPVTNITPGKVITAPINPERDGYLFDGWYLSSDYDESQKWDPSEPIWDNLELYAKWVRNNPFSDVKEGEYFYDPVLWAVNTDPQITSGTSATTFRPNATCTRAQVVTFLWRANGCPEPDEANSPFSDVKEDSYYYKAVLWAVEKGITTGTSPSTFSPDSGCTRGQVVTFLWRANNMPDPQNTNNPFIDVQLDAYYYNSVLWAVENNITKGTSADKFSPNATCTRAQIVTFLYRAII